MSLEGQGMFSMSVKFVLYWKIYQQLFSSFVDYDIVKQNTKHFHYKHGAVMRQRKVFDVDEYEMIMMKISKVE